jgi:hypothetical protein
MSYIDLLQNQLIAASERLGRSPLPRPSRRIISGRGRLHATIAVLLITSVSAAIADATGVLGPDLDFSAPSPLGKATVIPNQLSSSFEALRRSPKPGDVLPAGVSVDAVAGGLNVHYGINLALSRLAGSVDGTSIWIVPGSTGACIYTSDEGSVCARDDVVTTVGLVGVSGSSSRAGASPTFIGVVPDGAYVTALARDGSQVAVSRSGAAYEVSGVPQLASVTVHETDGQNFTLPVPGARSGMASPAPGAQATTPSTRPTGTTGLSDPGP